MSHVRLISWDPEDAKRRAAELEQEGVRVDASPLHPSGLIAQLRGVSAVCIDLDRLPSHGREIAVAMRQTKGTRFIPIVFAGGPKDKVLRIKRELPDAIYADWPKVAGTLRRFTRKPPVSVAAVAPAAQPVRPPSHMERYAGASLEKKLGIVAGMKIALIGAPDSFTESLRELPEGVQFEPKMNAESKLAIWFVRSCTDLQKDIEFFAARMKSSAALWVVYPKKAGKHKTDLTQGEVRKVALAAGLVDYKICAVDDDWSGLKFTRKK